MRRQLARLAIAAVLTGGALTAAIPGRAAAPDGSGPWADQVVSAEQGLQIDGSPVAATRSDTSQALGVAEETGNEGTFYTLGRFGTLTLQFDNPICNVEGADLNLVSATSDPFDTVNVSLSDNGIDFTAVTSDVSGSRQISLPDSMPRATFVRLVDSSVSGVDGYDLDGIEALGSGCSEGVFTCRATSLRVAGTEIAANFAETPCQGERVAGQRFEVPDLVTFGAFDAQTTVQFRNSALAQTDVGALTIPALQLAGGPLELHGLYTDARAYCTAAGPLPTLAVDRANIALTFNNTPMVAVPTPDGITYDLGPFGKLVTNEIIHEPTRITIRAVHYTGPLGEFVAGETSAGFSGNPCIFFGH